MMPLEREKPPPTDLHADPFAWDRDPMVVVSRRHRVIMYPAALLTREMTADEVAAHFAPPTTPNDVHQRDEKMLALYAGVNFLGAHTSVWHYQKHAERNMPQGAPPESALKLVWPFTTGHAVVSDVRSGNVDRDTNRLRPDRVRAVLERIVAFSKAHRHPQDADLWSASDGFDAPELQVLRLSELFDRRTQAANHAAATASISIKHHRRTPESATLIGALHDYAIRDRQGSALLAECRRWWNDKKLG